MPSRPFFRQVPFCGAVAVSVFAVAVCLPPPAGHAAGLKLSAQELAAREEKAGQDPVHLLLLCSLTEAEDGRRLRQRVAAILARERKSASAVELTTLAAKVATALPQAATSFTEVREILGRPETVTRQVLFRRYVEQWDYERPLPLLLVFDCRKGQEPRLQSVHVNRQEKN